MSSIAPLPKARVSGEHLFAKKALHRLPRLRRKSLALKERHTTALDTIQHSDEHHQGESVQPSVCPLSLSTKPSQDELRDSEGLSPTIPIRKVSFEFHKMNFLDLRNYQDENQKRALVRSEPKRSKAVAEKTKQVIKDCRLLVQMIEGRSETPAFDPVNPINVHLGELKSKNIFLMVRPRQGLRPLRTEPQPEGDLRSLLHVNRVRRNLRKDEQEKRFVPVRVPYGQPC